MQFSAGQDVRLKNYCSRTSFRWRYLSMGCLTQLSTIILRRTSTSHTPLESSRLAELKYAIFSRTGHNSKKLRHSNLFPLTIFKHGLLEGSAILLQYSSISCTKLESSNRRVEMCNFSRILRNWRIRAFESAKTVCVTNVHGHCSMGY